jgi:TetR/AcrR family acrAB operon transcriptional repressor
MNSRSEYSRAIPLDAVLMAFARHEISATSLEEAVMATTLATDDRDLSNKAAMVREVFSSLIWPFDIGADIYVYRQSSNPMQLLRDVLWLQMKNCLDDTLQRKLIRLLLLSSAADDLPDDLRGQLEYTSTLAIQRLTAVLNICYLRRGLRRGVTPIDVALDIHAAGLAILKANIGNTFFPSEQSFFLPVDRVLLAACKASCRNSPQWIAAAGVA